MDQTSPQNKNPNRRGKNPTKQTKMVNLKLKTKNRDKKNKMGRLQIDKPKKERASVREKNGEEIK